MPKIKLSEATSREFARHKQASDWYHSQRAMGAGGRRLAGADERHVLTLWNESGDDRRFGEVLAVSGLKTTNLDDRQIWLTGDLPNAAKPFGVLLEALPDGEPGDVVFGGPCIALVDIADADHQFAMPVDGEAVLQSCWGGPVRILYAPAGTGEQACAVWLSLDATGEVTPVADIDKGDSGACKILLNGADTGETIELLAKYAAVKEGLGCTRWGGYVLPWECAEE